MSAFRDNFVCAVKCQGKILREQHQDGESRVFLPFGSEYELLLKNLETRSVLVNISIDGVDVAGSIIVRPNSTTNLEGFLKGFQVTNKFKFIEKTQQISDFRGDRIDDGLIRIEYTFEASKPQVINEYTYHYHHDYYGWPWYYHYPLIKSYGNYTLTNSEGKFTSSNSIQSRSGDNLQGEQLQSVNCFNSNVNSEGITVPGNKSDQVFQTGNIDALETNSHVIVIKLSGIIQGEKKVEKPVLIKTKVQCSICGRRSKSDSRFCKNCGTALF